MPLYRTGVDRYAKYEAKYVPDTVGARFGQVKDIALKRAQAGLIEMATVDDLVRPILDKYGITGPARATYLGFAKKLMKHVMRHGGEAGKVFAQGLKAYYVTAMKADPTILDEIINVVIGAAKPY